MIVLENVCAEVTSRWYINSVVKKEQTIWVCRPLAICRDVFCSNWVTKKSQKDVLMKDVQIHNCSCMERRREKDSSSYKGHKLFLSKDEFKVVRVDSKPVFSLLEQTSHHLVRVSGLVPRQPGQNLMTRLNCERYLDYHTCLQVNTLVVEKYSRFL